MGVPEDLVIYIDDFALNNWCFMSPLDEVIHGKY